MLPLLLFVTSFLITITSAQFNGVLYGTGTTEQLKFTFGSDSSSSSISPINEFIATGNFQSTAGSESLEVSKSHQPAIMLSDFYFKYGRLTYEVKMATGQTLTSAKMYSSSTGVGLSVGGVTPTTVYPTLNGTYLDNDGYDTGCDLTDGYHNYTFEWSKDTIQYFFDDKLIKTVNSSSEYFIIDPATIGFMIERISEKSSKNKKDESAHLKSITLNDATGSYFYVSKTPDTVYTSADLMDGDRVIMKNSLDLSPFIVGNNSTSAGSSRTTTTLSPAKTN
ncbi:hypothetical protein DASC09_027100 [Saccharomycopsis crataegensis]|uniref:GH16 domain-containing protein n=1 Tax=Saccharomycopsis crataegensis TaxID=43959 RepID=A0AAV5QLH5_9ASCO|nr:hypothetical protein DASC09_027100 [Saccharomycopsis crataegensis]